LFFEGREKDLVIFVGNALAFAVAVFGGSEERAARADGALSSRSAIETVRFRVSVSIFVCFVDPQAAILRPTGLLVQPQASLSLSVSVSVSVVASRGFADGTSAGPGALGSAARGFGALVAKIALLVRIDVSITAFVWFARLGGWNRDRIVFGAGGRLLGRTGGRLGGCRRFGIGTGGRHRAGV
jgi:hypothetical protein